MAYLTLMNTRTGLHNLKNFVQMKQYPIEMETLLNKISDVSGFSPEQIIGYYHSKEANLYRHIFFYILRSKYKMKYTNISYLTGRNHSTIISSYKKVLLWIRLYDDVREKIAILI